MITSPTSHVPFAELPVEARALFSIIAMASLVRFGAPRPDRSEMNLVLETIWNANRLRLKDLSDPFRMTTLLTTELASVSLAGDGQGAQQKLGLSELSLPARHKFVARGVMAGKSNRAIAKELGVDDGTVGETENSSRRQKVSAR